jgi:hypothetical protein
MDTGSSSDVILIDGTNVSTHLAIPVQFTIHACDTTGLVVNVQRSDSLNGADCAAPHGPSPESFGQIFSFSGQQSEVVSIYVTGNFKGYVALDTSLTKPPLAQSSSCVGGTPGNPCIQYVTLPAPGQYLVEVAGQGQADTGLFTVIVADPRNPNSPDSLDQRLDATRSIPTGNSVGQDSVVLRAIVSDPDLGDTIHLQAEEQQTPTFSGVPNYFGTDSVLNGQAAHVSLTGLPNHQPVYWRIRAVDQTNHTSAWVAHGGNPDFSVAVSQPPANVSSATLSQFQANDSVSSYGVGAVVPTDTIVLAGQVSDPDPGDVVRLMVEVKPVSGPGSAFTGIATDSSAQYPGLGSFAKVRVGPLPNNTNYHWQGWAEDQTGRVSPSKSSFGSNSESATDFRVQVAHPPALPANLGQFQTDLTPIPVGDTANQGSVVFQATVSDTDGGTVSMYVEVQPIDTAFNGTIKGTSNPVPSGQVASVTLSSPLTNGKCYHWRAQAVDNTSRTSNWQPFGNNPETSADFCVQLPVSQLVFTQQPPLSTPAGALMLPAIQVTARNSLNQTVTSFSGPITLSLAANPGGGTLGGTLTVAASGGTATFSDMHINKSANGYKLLASALTFTATSNSFNIVPGAAAQLAFTIQPTSTGANTTITPAVQVSAWDADSNLVNSFTGPVTLSITSGSGTTGAVLSNPGPISAVAGVATFSNLSINLSGANYTLKAASGSLVQPTSAPFSITGGPIASLVFNVQPPLNTTAGAALTPAVQVTAKDASGNVANFNGQVTLALSPNGFGGTLSGTTFVNATGGVATFTNLRVRQAGTNYSLTASATGAPTITSNAFNINAGTATQLHFTTQPTTTADSAIIDSVTNVVVTAFDSTGLNVATSFIGTVRINITPGTGTAGAGLFGNQQQPALAGVARFNDLRINKLGTAYQLTATVSGGVPSSDDSQPFDIIIGPPKALFFTVQPPAQTVANVAMTPAVRVTARDAAGNTVTAFNGQVTLTITSGTGTAGAVLSGGVQSAVAGTATFSSLSINKSGTGYTLTAGSGTLTQDISTSFTILAGGPDALKSLVSANPLSITACKVGCSVPTSQSTITVTVNDGAGNPIQGATVTLASSSPSANVTQPVGGTAANGTITGFVSDTVSGPQQITATVIGTPNVIIAQQATVTVNAASPAAVQFIRNPTNTVAGTIIQPVNGVQVQVNDQFNNKASTANTSITLSILVPPSPAGGVLNGTTTRSAVSGLATFNDLRIKQAGLLYALGAVGSGLTIQDTSTQFNITPAPASKLVFIQPPTSTTGGATITPPVTVQIQDSVGNLINSSANVTLAITSGTGTAGAHLSGTLTVAASAGTATFNNLSIDSAGVNYTLNAASGALTGATSAQFTISVGAATKLLYGQQPTTTTAGANITPAVTVRIVDAGGNTTASTANVTLAITGGTGTTGAHLSGGSSVTVAATAGVANFNTLSIDSVGTNYTLNATSGALTGATSSAFNINGGLASKLAFGTQPTTTTGGATIAPAVTVRILDAGGNLTNSNANVTLAITGGTGTAGAHLSGGATVTVAASAGTATFNTLNVDSAGTLYTLSATSGVLTGATSNTFNINVGAASKLAFGVQPISENSATSFAPAPTVRILDAGGNLTNSGASVTVAISSGTGTAGAHLSGTVTVSASAGTAQFSTLSIDSAGTGYQLRATSGALTAATSTAFTINVGSATKLGFRIQPANTGGGATMATVQVEIRDAGGNRVTSGSRNIVLSLTTNPNSGTLSGTTTVASASGLANFATLSIDSAGSGYVMTATASGGPPLAGIASNSFDITVGAAAQLIFLVQPADPQSSGMTVIPAVQVEVADLGGNRVTSSTATIAIDFGNNPGGNALGGTVSKQAAAGLVSFDDLVITGAGSGYTLVATSSGLTGTGPSNPFTVN